VTADRRLMFCRDVTIAMLVGAAAVAAAAPAPAATAPGPAATAPAPAAAATTPPAPPAAAPVIEPGSKRAKELAQHLVTEGIALVEQKQYQLALDRFVAAYELFPTPKLLLNMASTLREMGRRADAADMYQAFIEAPDTNPEFVGEAKAILNSLDDQLYVLMVRVTPPGSDVQLDGGPWVSVGDKRLMVRLSPGIHMVAARKAGFALEERTINAFEGENNELDLVLKVPVPEATTVPVVVEHPDGVVPPVEPPPARSVAAGGGTSKDGSTVFMALNTGVRAERGGAQHQSTAVFRNDNDDIVQVLPPPVDTEGNEFGVTAQLRIDGAGGGAAAAFGLSFSPASMRRLELDLTGMVSRPTPPDMAAEPSRIFGVFFGIRYRLMTGQIRPTLGAGMPMFFSDGAPRVGVRAAAGGELVINGHLAVVIEAGYERFFNPQAGYRASVFVPLVQLTGRL